MATALRNNARVLARARRTVLGILFAGIPAFTGNVEDAAKLQKMIVDATRVLKAASPGSQVTLPRESESSAQISNSKWAFFTRTQAAQESGVRHELERSNGDELSTSLRFKQFVNGVEIFGQPSIFHYDRNGVLKAQNIQANPGALSREVTTPQLSESDALKIVQNEVGVDAELSEPAKLLLYPVNALSRTATTNDLRLVYRLRTKSKSKKVGREIYLDATNGKVWMSLPRAHSFTTTALELPTLQRKGQFTVYNADTPMGRKMVDPGGFPRGETSEDTWYHPEWYSNEMDASANRALRNMTAVYDYYKGTHDRDSYDGAGGALTSIVHFGTDFANAIWSDEYAVMAYGDGNERLGIRDLTYGLDVAGHEMTHGLTAKTSNLVYLAEPGALNESYSDFFGRMIDYREGYWDIGAAVITPEAAKITRAIRNMMRPEDFGQPGNTKSELAFKIPEDLHDCDPDLNDMCGVHQNNGIPNHAAALITTAIGREKTERLYFKVLTQALSALSTFKGARVNTELQCKLMYGEKSSECISVKKAFDLVGM